MNVAYILEVNELAPGPGVFPLDLSGVRFPARQSETGFTHPVLEDSLHIENHLFLIATSDCSLWST